MDFQDIKVKDLANKTGISPRTLEGYIGNRASIPPADVAVKIANALNVTVEYLVTGKQQREKKQNPENSSIKKSIDNMPVNNKLLLKDIVDLMNNYDVRKIPHQ